MQGGWGGRIGASAMMSHTHTARQLAWEEQGDILGRF